MSLICQPTSEDIKLYIIIIVNTELRSCVKVEVDVPNKPTVSVDVKQHFNQIVDR